MQEDAGILLRAYSDVRNRIAQEVTSEPNWEYVRATSSPNATSMQWPYTIVIKN